jgi:hypothetical protein
MAKPNNITRIGAITAAVDLGTVQHSNHFLVEIIPLKKRVGSNTVPNKLANLIGLLLGQDGEFNWFVKDIKLPTLTHDFNQIQRGNSYYFEAKPTNWGDTSISINDSIPRDLEGFFYEWHHIIHDVVTDVTGLREDYICDIKVTELWPDGEVRPAWYFKDCFITSVEPGNLDYSNQDFKAISVSLKFTRAYREATPQYPRDIINQT